MPTSSADAFRTDKEPVCNSISIKIMKRKPPVEPEGFFFMSEETKMNVKE